MTFYYSDRIDYAGWISGSVLVGLSGWQTIGDAFFPDSELEVQRLNASILLFLIVLGGVLWLQAYVRSTKVSIYKEHVQLTIYSQAAVSMCLIHVGATFTLTPLMLLYTNSNSIIYNLGILTIAASNLFAAYRIWRPRFQKVLATADRPIRYCAIDARMILFFDIEDGCVQLYFESGFINTRNKLLQQLADVGAKEAVITQSASSILTDFPRPSIYYLPALKSA